MLVTCMMLSCAGAMADGEDTATGSMATLSFVSPEFVTPRQSDEGGSEPYDALARHLLFSPGMDSTPANGQDMGPSPELPQEHAADAQVRLCFSLMMCRLFVAEPPALGTRCQVAEKKFYCLQAPDAGHILPAAGTANFGVSAVAAIPEPVATAAAETARRLTGSGAILSAAADGGAGADIEEFQAASRNSNSREPEAQTAGPVHSSAERNIRQSIVDAADNEAQRPVVSFLSTQQWCCWLVAAPDSASTCVTTSCNTPMSRP